MASNGITARRSFHRIWIAGKKSLVKRAPGHIYYEQNHIHQKGNSLVPDRFKWNLDE